MPNRTPTTRCKEEFNKLLAIRYRQKFGEGLELKPNKRRLKFEYRSATSSFQGLQLSIGDLPDVTSLTAPLSRLVELADSCCEALDGYSRLLGRSPEKKGSPAALSLLPTELIESSAKIELNDLENYLKSTLQHQNFAIVSVQALLSHWPGGPVDKLSKTDAVSLSQVIEKLGFGIEPEARLSAPVPDLKGKCVLFRLSGNPVGTVSEDYRKALLLVKIACYVANSASASDPRTEKLVIQYISSVVALEPAETERLTQHLRWLLASSVKLTGVKTELRNLDDRQRKSLGLFLIAVAAVDGQIEAKEISALAKAYELLGLDPDSLYHDVHSLSALDPIDAPVTIVKARAGSGGFSIPKPERSGAESQHASFSLDMGRLEQKLRDSAKASELLSAIFTYNTDEQPAPAAPSVSPTAALDERHLAFLSRLLAKPLWQRSEVEAIARELQLMTDGALERLNEFAFEKCDQPLLEGENPIEINQSIVEEVSA